MERLCCFCLKKKNFATLKKYISNSKRYTYQENLVPISYKRYIDETIQIENSVDTKQIEFTSTEGFKNVIGTSKKTELNYVI